jgi:hypothetical protein
VAAECPHVKAIGRPDREEALARLGYSHMTEAITATPGIRVVEWSFFGMPYESTITNTY